MLYTVCHLIRGKVKTIFDTRQEFLIGQSTYVSNVAVALYLWNDEPIEQHSAVANPTMKRLLR